MRRDPPGMDATRHALHLPSLLLACLIMLVGTLYPPLFLGAANAPDHLFLTLLLCAMSVGFVRGVGLVPGPPLWRWAFSAWSCVAFLLLAAAARVLH